MKKKKIILSYIAIFIIIPISCMELPTDIWNKVIACSTAKNQFAYISTQFNQLNKRTNLCIYIQSPLILLKKDLQFALLYATYCNNTRAVENLLKYQASPNYYDSLCHLLPQNLAQSRNNYYLINIFEKYHAACDTKIPPLYAQAAYCGDLPTLKNYVENKGNAPHYPSYDDNPVVHSAISNGHTHIIEYLLKDPHIQPYINHKWYDITRLYFAAKHNRAAITQLLIQAAPSMINDTCDRGFTALHVAVYYKHYHVVEILLVHPEIKVNFSTRFSISPLHTAVNNGDLKMVELLLSAPKIILNIKSSENKTPLDIATKLYNEATNSEKKRIYADIQRLLTKKRAKTFFYLDKIALWEKNRKNIVKNF